MLASTPTPDYMPFLARPRDVNMSPSCRAVHNSTPPRRPSNHQNSYDSPPMLTPSPYRTRQIVPSHFSPVMNDSDDIFLQSPFKATRPAHPAHTTGDDDNPRPLACPPPAPVAPLFFPTSESQPLRTPVKQMHRVPSRPALTVKHINTLPHPATTTSAPTNLPARVGVGTKRKSAVPATTFSTPLRQRVFTPLSISTTKNVDPRSGVSFDILAPLPAPRFNTRTPHTKAETEVYLKTQTNTMTQLRISDLNDSSKDFGTDGEDSGCEVGDDENDTGDAFFLDISKKTDPGRDQSTGKRKGTKEEIVEASSPDGHITKRRARSRPLSLELLENSHPLSSPDDNGSIKRKSRIGNGSTPSPETGSPLPRRRVGSTAPKSHTQLRQTGFGSPSTRPLNRLESSGTLFFGPTIPDAKSKVSSAPALDGPTTNPRARPRNVHPHNPHRHSYGGPDETFGRPWTTLPSQARSPSPNSSPLKRTLCSMSDDSDESGDDEDMFFSGPQESSFMFSVTGDTPSPRINRGERVAAIPKKYKPRDSGISLSDDERRAYLMPKASTSDGSIHSDADEGLVTPGAGPSPVSGWPEAAVVVSSFYDEMVDNVLGGGQDMDEFILRTIAAGAKGPQEYAKKVPGTPVKKVKTSHLAISRPWQSAVANKVGFGTGFELGGGRNAPRKSLPAAFPDFGKGAATDSDEEGEDISPSLRKDRYMGVGFGMPSARKSAKENAKCSRWLMRRSSSGAFSSGGESIGTPTGLRGRDLNVPTPHVPAFSPSKNRHKVSSSQTTLGSPGSTVTFTTPSCRHLPIAGGRRKSHGAVMSTNSGNPGRFDRDFVQVEEVGSGQFGNVIKVRSKHGSGEMFAVKKSKPFEGVRHRNRLREEVEILQHLSEAARSRSGGSHGHPNVLSYVDSWEEDERLFICTELCELGNFARFLWEYGRAFPRLDEARVWKIIADLSNGLLFIHEAGVIHLDLKPANIFVTGEGRFKIGDFGMASRWPRGSHVDGGTFEREGDKLYLAPEVLQGKYGKAADVFSFGMTILETASNMVVPDQGEPWHRLRQEDFEREGLGGSPEMLELIRSMMRTEPEKRVKVEDVYGHEVVSRARGAMERAYVAAKGRGTSVFCASPLASVADGFLEEILGRDVEMEEAS